MKNFKKALRLIGLVFLIVLASCGVGITGALFSNKSGQYQDREIKIELTQKKDDEDEEENLTLKE